MSEITFAGKAKKLLDLFIGRNQGEFVDVGLSLIESEELSDAVYETYLALITDGGWQTRNSLLGIDDIGEAYLNGFYLPCCSRPVLSGQIDLMNDDLPSYAGVVFYNDQRRKSEKPLFVSVRKVTRFSRRVRCPPFTEAKYAITWLWETEPNTRDRLDRRLNKSKNPMTALTACCAVMPSGVVVPCPENDGWGTSEWAAFIHCATAAINSYGDRRHVWQVETHEPLIGAKSSTPLTLGCSPEHIKSLFYARSLPVTESGRKRPILHWVRAHNRRLREGIDIDIEKHLRGINVFEMDGFAFEITNPYKRNKR